MLYRQGDVALRKVEKPVLKNARGELNHKQTKVESVVLAEGEVTGHNHVLHGDLMLFDFPDTQRFVEFKAPAKLVHQEHTALSIPPGFYQIIRQREFNGVSMRRVAD